MPPRKSFRLQSAGDEAIDLYIRQDQRDGNVLGPLAPASYFWQQHFAGWNTVNLILIHAAHHFSNLIPTSAG